jgi:hypothetical protein
VSVENVKAKAVEILKSLTEHDLWSCFEHWQHRMQLCFNSEGNYFEGDCSFFLNLLNRKSYRHGLVLFFCVGLHIYSSIFEVIKIICKFCVKDNLSRVSLLVKITEDVKE